MPVVCFPFEQNTSSFCQRTMDCAFLTSRGRGRGRGLCSAIYNSSNSQRLLQATRRTAPLTRARSPRKLIELAIPAFVRTWTHYCWRNPFGHSQSCLEVWGRTWASCTWIAYSIFVLQPPQGPSCKLGWPCPVLLQRLTFPIDTTFPMPLPRGLPALPSPNALRRELT